MRKVIKKKLQIVLFLLILIITPNLSRAEEGNDTQITVFCTNNKDGTGSCLTSLQESVECILIPGSIVECTDKDKNELSCVSVHSTSAIAEISCENPKVESKRIDNVDIPITSKEFNSESAANNKRDGSGRFENRSESELAPPDRPRFVDTDESPFADPF